MTYRGRTYRMPATRWRDRDFATLPADAIALEAMAGCYSADTLTDGEITREHVRLIGTQMGMSARRIREAVARLVDAGFWMVSGPNWRSVSYQETNISRQDLETVRASDAARKRNERAQQNQALSSNVQDGHDTGQPPGHPEGAHARALSPGLLVTKENISARDPDDVPRMVRVAFEERFLAAHAVTPGWSTNASRCVGTIAMWAIDTGRRRGESPKSVVDAVMAGYFASADAIAKRTPIAYLNADPGRYLPPVPVADPRATLRAELAEAQQSGNHARASELLALLRAA